MKKDLQVEKGNMVICIKPTRGFSVGEMYQVFSFNKKSFTIALRPEFGDYRTFSRESTFFDLAEKPILNQEETEKECMFKKYGFEVPDFECEIFKKINKYVFGYLLTKDWRDNEYISCSWDENGILCKDIIDDAIAEDISSSYNLTPIKKPWHEDESNFPIAIIDDCDNIRVMHFEESLNFNIWRPATKEEVLNLYKEVK